MRSSARRASEPGRPGRRGHRPALRSRRGRRNSPGVVTPVPRVEPPNGRSSACLARVVTRNGTGIIALTAYQPGDSAWIEARPVKRYLAVGPAAPNAPTALTARPVSDTRIRLGWTYTAFGVQVFTPYFALGTGGSPAMMRSRRLLSSGQPRPVSSVSQPL